MANPRPETPLVPALDPTDAEVLAHHAEDQLIESVSRATVSFIGCAAALNAYGELLRELRLALQAKAPAPRPTRSAAAAANLAARLDGTRTRLDDAAFEIDRLLGAVREPARFRAEA